VNESAVKKALRAYLGEIGAYQYWPVPMGYGAATIDVLVCYKGRFYGIETKRPKVTKATVRQASVLREIAEAGGGVCVENSPGLEAVRDLLDGPDAL
jgi:hypothetical protein